MNSYLPVLLLLVFNLYVFLAAVLERRGLAQRSILPSLLFFCSGIPALIYQIVWQRALFAIYGVNSESVAVVVTAFMIGLGIGSLLGGWLSVKYPGRALPIFATAELIVALFGVFSLRLFHWVATYTAGARLELVVVLSLALLSLPTICMGMTLPLLAGHLVAASRAVGVSVGILYFANTFGSAVACFMCARFLMRDFGQSGSVYIAASINAAVAAAAWLLGKRKPSSAILLEVSENVEAGPMLSLGVAMVLAGSVGFISLGLEIIWFRVFVLASSDRAPSFALLLATFLSGIAAGSFIGGKLAQRSPAATNLFAISASLFTAAAVSCYLTPLVAWLSERGFDFMVAVPAFFLVAGLLGAVFTLLCKLAVPAGVRAGRGVSLIYVANIVGSASGSLMVGFFLMNHLGLMGVTLILAAGAFVLATAIIAGNSAFRYSRMAVPAGALVAIVTAPILYAGAIEKLVLQVKSRETGTFQSVIENRNGIIAVTRDGAVFGTGVYDGYFNTDPFNDKNLIVRAYAVGAFLRAPKRVLMIGLSSGSWAQVLVNNPGVESLEIVEINAGYLQLIPKFPQVRSILTNPRVRIHIDDGRRWLSAHPDARYDLIVQNTSFFWRDHSSELLSVDYLRLIRSHLTIGGVYYYNTTGSDDVLATGLSVFPFGLRVLNFLAVSDSPLGVDKQDWASALKAYEIDGRQVFNPNLAQASRVLANYMGLADSVSRPQQPYGMEDAVSMRNRLRNQLIITDDNMGWEWR